MVQPLGVVTASLRATGCLPAPSRYRGRAGPGRRAPPPPARSARGGIAGGGTAPHAPGIAPVPRRLPRLRLVRGPSPLPGLVVATVGVLLAAAWIRPPGRPAPGMGHPIDAAVRRLRAAVVADLDGPARPGGTTAVVTTDPPSDVVERPRRRDSASRADARRTLAARARAAAGRTLTLGVPWWADSAHWGPEVIRWREATRPPLVVDAGDTVTVAGPDIPALLPNVLRRRGVQWTSDGPALVLDAAAGPDGARRVVAGGPGLASVTASTAAGRTVTPLRVRAAVRGRVYPADGAAPPPARVVIVRRTGLGGARGDTVWTDTVWTDAAGCFRAPLPDDWDGTADVRVELSGGAGTGPATYPAVAVAGVPATRLHTLGIVLLPARWAPAAGSHAGTSVPVRAAAARGFWRFAVSAAGVWRPVGWADDVVRTVAFEASPSGAPGAPPNADTAAFWAAARALGDVWGRPLFRPAPPGADADVTVHVTPGLSALGLTTLAYDAGDGVIGGAHVEFRTPAAAADPRVVAHELLHALGFGHVRGWPSVLAPTGAWGATAPTAADVAYGQLFEGARRAARRAEREYGAAYGWGGTAP